MENDCHQVTGGTLHIEEEYDDDDDEEEEIKVVYGETPSLIIFRTQKLHLLLISPYH